MVRLATVVAMWPLLSRIGYGLNWREGVILVRSACVLPRPMRNLCWQMCPHACSTAVVTAEVARAGVGSWAVAQPVCAARQQHRRPSLPDAELFLHGHDGQWSLILLHLPDAPDSDTSMKVKIANVLCAPISPGEYKGMLTPNFAVGARVTCPAASI